MDKIPEDDMRILKPNEQENDVTIIPNLTAYSMEVVVSYVFSNIIYL